VHVDNGLIDEIRAVRRWAPSLREWARRRESGMIAEVQYALSWRKEATRRLVNFAAPGTEVRPEARFILGGQPPQTFVVKRTYENIIRWIISRLSPGSGKPLETFLAVSDGPGMYIAEEAWTVPPPSRKPDLYVFYDGQSRPSGELKTANPVSVQSRVRPNRHVRADRAVARGRRPPLPGLLTPSMP